MKSLIKIFFLSLVITSCGGGSDSPQNLMTAIPFTSWQKDLFLPADNFRNKCSIPRTGINPFSNTNYPDIKGERLDENNFLRSYSNNTYLWYDEIVDENPEPYNTSEYFQLLKTPNDRFHFSLPSDEWYQLSQSGIEIGYGAAWSINAETKTIIVLYTEPNSPATLEKNNLERGDEIIGIDDIEINQSTSNVLINNALFPEQANQTHNFKIKKNINGEIVNISMSSTIITKSPVQYTKVITTDTGKVGYLLFNDHIATAEKGLFDAITLLKKENINDLILDLRYNGGGYLAIANQLTYMLAGAEATAGRIFERLEFNDKHPINNPVTGEVIEGISFYPSTIGLSSISTNTPLPTLDLNTGSLGKNRIFVITSNATCSASESIINSLIGIDIEVIQIGTRTCGKPYGFYPEDNCGTTYFTIQFKGINSRGFGDYADGFRPRNNSGEINMPIGCIVNDDVKHALGSISESGVATALSYRKTNNCPSIVSARNELHIENQTNKISRIIKKSPWLTNRIF